MESNFDSVNILGTEYHIVVNTPMCQSLNADGICKVYDKLIVMRECSKLLDADDSYETKEQRFNEVMRHEIIHAFFDESGLEEYSNDEQLVCWLAKQFPKMLKVFEDTSCI